MKRIAFFAHYDRDGLIDDYVLYYLRGLAKVADRILFASDCELRPGEAMKLSGLAELVFAARHCEYDFGSWKRCFEAVRYDLTEWDELIIANDSCFAPVFSFEPLFERVEPNVPVWGASYEVFRDGAVRPQNFGPALPGEVAFLNSYFMVFRRPVLDDSAFFDFWRAVRALPTKEEVIERYEVGLSALLQRRRHIFRALTYRKPALFYPNLDMPWARVHIFKTNGEAIPKLGKKLAKLDAYYPRSLIDRHIKRLLGTYSPPTYFLGKKKPKGIQKLRRSLQKRLRYIASTLPIWLKASACGV